jgi:hypothetical protein
MSYLPALLAAAEQPERLPACIGDIEEGSARRVGYQLMALTPVAVDEPVHHHPPQPPVHLAVVLPATASERPGVGFVEGLLDIVGGAVSKLPRDLADELLPQRPDRDPIQRVARALTGTPLDNYLPHCPYTRAGDRFGPLLWAGRRVGPLGLFVDRDPVPRRLRPTSPQHSHLTVGPGARGVRGEARLPAACQERPRCAANACREGVALGDPPPPPGWPMSSARHPTLTFRRALPSAEATLTIAWGMRNALDLRALGLPPLLAAATHLTQTRRALADVLNRHRPGRSSRSLPLHCGD